MVESQGEVQRWRLHRAQTEAVCVGLEDGRRPREPRTMAAGEGKETPTSKTPEARAPGRPQRPQDSEPTLLKAASPAIAVAIRNEASTVSRQYWSGISRFEGRVSYVHVMVPN